MKITEHFHRLIVTGLAAAIISLLSGCATLLSPVEDQARFYVLAVPDYTPASAEAPTDAVVLGLARVRVARYLEDPGIAIREDGTRIVYSQRHRWAESLEHGVTRLLTENLNEEPVVARTLLLPAQRRPLPDLDLHVSISRAEGVLSREAGSHAIFRASWELRSGVEGEVVVSGQVRADELPWNGEDFQQLVASLSEGVGQLTQDIAHAVAER